MSVRRRLRSRLLAIVLLGLVASLLAACAKSGAAIPPPPDQPGCYYVGYYDVSYSVSPYGEYTARIFYPALSNGSSVRANASAAPYPGIVATDGLLSTWPMIDWIPQYLASQGYIALCFTTPNPSSNDSAQWAYGFEGGISKLKSENSLNVSPIYHMLGNPSNLRYKFGIIGMSTGGAGVMEAAADNPSGEIGAAVALAPGADDQASVSDVNASAAKINVPIQLQVGSNDGLVPPDSVSSSYNLIPGTTVKEFLEINGANHIGYLNEEVADFVQQLGEDYPCTIGFGVQHQVASRYFTAWFGRYLKGFTAYDSYISGSEVQNDSYIYYLYSSGRGYQGDN